MDESDSAVSFVPVQSTTQQCSPRLTSETGKEARKEDEQGNVRDGRHAEPEPAKLDAEGPQERQKPVEEDNGGKSRQERQLDGQRRVPAREVVVLVVVERQREEEGEGQVQESAAGPG